MIFEVTCDLRRSITNLRDWDNNDKGKDAIEEDIGSANQLLFLEEHSLPWYKEIAQKHKLTFVIVVPLLDESAGEILTRIQRQFSFVTTRHVADFTAKDRLGFESSRWTEPVAAVPITPWELYTEEAFRFLESQCCGIGELRQFVFEMNYHATAHTDGLKRLRIFNEVGSVVSVGYRFDRDPRLFSYKSVAAASYYNSLTRVTHSPGFLNLNPPGSLGRSPEVYPLVGFDWRSLPNQINDLYIEDSAVSLVSSSVYLDEELAFACDVGGPFKISIDVDLGEKIQTKSALFSFELVDHSGEPIDAGRSIEGLACSTSASIGYFFYLLSSSPGNNSFTHLIQLPEDVKCRSIRLRRWGNRTASIKLNSLSVEEQ